MGNAYNEYNEHNESWKLAIENEGIYDEITNSYIIYGNPTYHGYVLHNKIQSKLSTLPDDIKKMNPLEMSYESVKIIARTITLNAMEYDARLFVKACSNQDIYLNLLEAAAGEWKREQARKPTVIKSQAFAYYCCFVLGHVQYCIANLGSLKQVVHKVKKREYIFQADMAVINTKDIYKIIYNKYLDGERPSRYHVLFSYIIDKIAGE